MRTDDTQVRKEDALTMKPSNNPTYFILNSHLLSIIKQIFNVAKTATQKTSHKCLG